MNIVCIQWPILCLKTDNTEKGKNQDFTSLRLPVCDSSIKERGAYQRKHFFLCWWKDWMPFWGICLKCCRPHCSYFLHHSSVIKLLLKWYKLLWFHLCVTYGWKQLILLSISVKPTTILDILLICHLSCQLFYQIYSTNKKNNLLCNAFLFKFSPLSGIKMHWG